MPHAKGFPIFGGFIQIVVYRSDMGFPIVGRGHASALHLRFKNQPDKLQFEPQFDTERDRMRNDYHKRGARIVSGDSPLNYNMNNTTPRLMPWRCAT
jgi:hypothetical protein